MRICPRCEHECSDRVEWCTQCGAQLVLYTTRPRRTKTPRKKAVTRVREQAVPAGEVITTFPEWSLADVCWLHGVDCDRATCSVNRDLQESGLL